MITVLHPPAKRTESFPSGHWRQNCGSPLGVLRFRVKAFIFVGKGFELWRAFSTDKLPLRRPTLNSSSFSRACAGVVAPSNGTRRTRLRPVSKSSKVNWA